VKRLYKQNTLDPIHEIDGFGKTKIIHQDHIHCPSPAHDEHKPHDPDKRRHDHRDNGQIGKEISPREIIAQKKEGNGDANNRRGNDCGYPEEKGIHKGFEVKGVCEKIVEVHQCEDTLIGRKSIIEETDEGIDEKDTKEGPN